MNFLNTSQAPIRHAMLPWLVGVVCAAAAGTVAAQTNRDTRFDVPESAVNAAVIQSRQPQRDAIEAATLPPAPVTLVATPILPAAVAGPLVILPGPIPLGPLRVVRVPAACTPKTNSLDCVQDSSQQGQGANVQGRVRNSVIGEVGEGRSATEGGSGAKRQAPCTPKPGELECK